MVQFRRFIDQVAAQQHTVGFGRTHGPNHLPSEIIGAFRPKMNIADVHQATRIVPRRNALLTNVERSLKTDFQTWRRHALRFFPINDMMNDFPKRL